MKLKNLLFIKLIVSAGLLQSQEIEKTVASNDSLSEAMTQQDSIQSEYKIKRLLFFIILATSKRLRFL